MLKILDNGKVGFSEDATEAFKQAIYKAHDGKLPNDITFFMCLQALQLLKEYGTNSEDLDEAIINSVDVYTSSLVSYVSSHTDRFFAASEYIENREANDLISAIQLAQIEEMRHCVYCLREVL